MQGPLEICEKICKSCRYKAGSRGFFAKAPTHCYCTSICTPFIFVLKLLALKMNMVRAVLDPELMLQDSKYIKPVKPQLHFRPSRKYATSKHYIHVRVPFDFTDLGLIL
jgi:hypothetical protein